MLYLFSGSDRTAVRKESEILIKKIAKKADVVRITDAHTVDDLSSALSRGGMFSAQRLIILDGTFSQPEMRDVVQKDLPRMKASEDTFLILEEKLDASTRKLLEKYSEDSKRFDSKKKEAPKTIFALANALRKGDKKALWVGYQRELLASAPEAIHGVLFWAAKQMVLSARGTEETVRAKKMIAELAVLPHEARRRGEEPEYALEKFVLSSA